VCGLVFFYCFGSPLFGGVFHPPSVDKCFVPSDALNEKARSRGLDPVSQIVQYGLPIRKGFWSNTSGESSSSPSSSAKQRKIPFFGKSKTESATSSKVKLREELGLETDLPTCLVVGGGDGMGGIVPISSALGKQLGLGNDDDSPQYQMVIVCGSNKEAQSTLQTMDWGPGVEVKVQGFVSNMDEWMNAADCLVTKAGPGTIAEASICGLPCMLFAYL
jgi:1,2-diacylglycerol 3-beta-galactosyltransferase